MLPHVHVIMNDVDCSRTSLAEASSFHDKFDQCPHGEWTTCSLLGQPHVVTPQVYF